MWLRSSLLTTGSGFDWEHLLSLSPPPLSSSQNSPAPHLIAWDTPQGTAEPLWDLRMMGPSQAEPSSKHLAAVLLWTWSAGFGLSGHQGAVGSYPLKWGMETMESTVAVLATSKASAWIDNWNWSCPVWTCLHLVRFGTSYICYSTLQCWRNEFVKQDLVSWQSSLFNLSAQTVCEKQSALTYGYR